MNTYHPNADSVARQYIKTTEPLQELGWGIDGVVYASPSASTAVKVHANTEKFESELNAYLRLYKHRVTELQGISIPKLVRFHRALRVIEISIVRPPFLLDFAATTLDQPKDFPEGVIDDWWEQTAEKFGDDFPTAQSVFWELANKYRIYYWDLKPGNLTLR